MCTSQGQCTECGCRIFRINVIFRQADHDSSRLPWRSPLSPVSYSSIPSDIIWGRELNCFASMDRQMWDLFQNMYTDMLSNTSKQDLEKLKAFFQNQVHSRMYYSKPVFYSPCMVWQTVTILPLCSLTSETGWLREFSQCPLSQSIGT